MYKLVAIGGILRGREYPLSEGDNHLGRDEANNIIVQLDGISKNHCKITVHGNVAYLEDLGSSNGTFVNGKIIKKVSIKDKDRIAVPNSIFQLVYVTEKKIIIKKKIQKQNNEQEEGDNEVEETPPMPASPIGKITHLFQYKIMPFLYVFNKEYEWKWMLAAFLFLFIVVTIFLTIVPVLSDSKTILMSEIRARGFHYADQIVRLNAVHLSRKNLDSIDTKFLESEPGVESYELFDNDGRIVRPLGKLNEYITDAFSIEAKEKAAADHDRYGKFIGDGRIGISKPIKAYNVKSGQEELVGVIAIKFAPTSLLMEAANNSKAYMESFTTSALVAIVFFAFVYFLTIKHFDDLRFQIDQVIRGRQKEITPKYLLSEIKPLVSIINTVLLKYLDMQNTGTSSDNEIEEDGKYVTILREFMLGANGPAIVLNSEKMIQFINPTAEDLTGIRESAAAGMGLIDMARDQGFAATVIDLCDQSANNGGVSQKGSYELSGVPYSLYITSLIGKDNFAKAFYISFVKE
ncbi:MAG: FHA domain-containing protein [Oligoflexia bacterium]|nr:FHA domain-containing protein [Oligoflexia bacterium]MBF0364368.1 FHA domain-containing protein [Oligoflexia bacterium]